MPRYYFLGLHLQWPYSCLLPFLLFDDFLLQDLEGSLREVCWADGEGGVELHHLLLHQ